MCGIVGYIGNRKAVPIILDGLRRLEYRGYDSAGIAVLNGDNQLAIRRASGKLRNLEDAIRVNPIDGPYGIGHTRWATPGRPTDKMHKRTINLLCPAFVAALTATVTCLGQTSPTVDVSDPRALAQAALQLERLIGVAINYEDVPYAYAGDISNVTASVMTPAQRAASPVAQIIVPRGGEISVDLMQVPGLAQPSALSLTTLVSAAPLIEALIAAHSAKGFPGVYTSTSSNGAFYIIPKQVRDVSGALTNVVPALDAKVNLPYQERTAADTLDAILQQASQVNGVEIGLGSAPFNVMLSTSVSMSAANETARSVLGRMLLTLASQTLPDGSAASLLAYHLYYEPRLRYWMLNVHNISSSQSGAVPAQQTQPVASGSGSNPYSKRN
jgi:hypothetical protein